ncbi:MAG: hypothetical protein JWL90_4501, partial [Chthoniobacteraceae bacterium]|nr:hypothetical protein [Chthoniobacteraceae bacterium]
ADLAAERVCNQVAFLNAARIHPIDNGLRKFRNAQCTRGAVTFTEPRKVQSMHRMMHGKAFGQWDHVKARNHEAVNEKKRNA